jgi:hypothetical protein
MSRDVLLLLLLITACLSDIDAHNVGHIAGKVDASRACCPLSLEHEHTPTYTWQYYR